MNELGQIESVDDSIIFANAIELFIGSWFLVLEICNIVADFWIVF